MWSARRKSCGGLAAISRGERRDPQRNGVELDVGEAQRGQLWMDVLSLHPTWHVTKLTMIF
jgi:hypothetical protein